MGRNCVTNEKPYTVTKFIMSSIKINKLIQIL